VFKNLSMLFVHQNDPSVKSLRSYLIKLVLVAVLPLLLFSSGLVFYVSHQQNLELENTLATRARAVQSVVDDKLNSILSSLQILAYTEEFNPNEFHLIHRRLSRAAKSMDGWESISIADLDGKLLIHTAYSYGDRLQSLSDLDFFQEVIQTGKPVFSNLRTGRSTGKKVISVAIPIMAGKRPSLILVANINYDLIVQTLRSMQFPLDWTATIIDRDSVIMARTRMPEKFVGTRISDELREKVKGIQTGFVKSKNKEGIPSLSAFTKSPITNWTVVLGFPVANLSNFSDLTYAVLVLAVFFIVLGIIIAIKIGSKISRPIVALSHSAAAFGKGYAPKAVDSTVEEIKILAQNLELASLQRISSENAIRTLYEISSSLSGELDLKRLLQSFTDQTTALTGAEYGAYYNTANSDTEFFDIVTLSGIPQEVFESSSLPQTNNFFAETFKGESIIRIDDITKDPRYGQDQAFFGIPNKNLSVKSYLAVSVISRTGDVLGGLFFGHSRPGVFTEQDEKLMGALAAQAATAIDNASLYSKATQAVELRDTFLSVASHELKTPLTSIYLQFELLKRSTQKTSGNDPKVMGLFDRFQSQLERLTRLINELLDVTRIASGKMDLHLEKVELEKIVSDICANFESEALQKGSPISLTVKEPVVGDWDLNRIEQVVMNLVSNAIKYGNKKPIEVMIYKNEKYAMVQIKDNGLGIAPEDQGRIFQRFERAIDSNSISGLGLGLFICNEIILRHGGDIKVESILGEGSTFTIRLPY
jgi:signal transduction histidine kinase